MIKAVFFLLCLFELATAVYANEESVYGETYPIAEDDLLQYIENRSKKMQQNGEWARWQESTRKRAEHYADRPQPIKEISVTRTAKVWRYDPTFKTSTAITDVNGKVLIPAGEVVNPLNYVSLHQALLFYDADEEKQVQWAKKMSARWRDKVKMILTNGSVAAQVKLFQHPVYFDQGGRLSAQLGIRHVPAYVMQKEKYLEVTEVLP